MAFTIVAAANWNTSEYQTMPATSATNKQPPQFVTEAVGAPRPWLCALITSPGFSTVGLAIHNQISIQLWTGAVKTWSYLGVQKRQLVGIESVQAERRAIVRPLFVWSQRQSRLKELLSSSRHVWGEANHLCAQQCNTRLAKEGRSRYSSPELAWRSFHIVRIMQSILEP